VSFVVDDELIHKLMIFLINMTDRYSKLLQLRGNLLDVGLEVIAMSTLN